MATKHKTLKEAEMRTRFEKELARVNIDRAEAEAKKCEAAGQEGDARVARIPADVWRKWLTEG